jgi:hypothetical protein
LSDHFYFELQRRVSPQRREERKELQISEPTATATAGAPQRREGRKEQRNLSKTATVTAGSPRRKEELGSVLNSIGLHFLVKGSGVLCALCVFAVNMSLSLALFKVDSQPVSLRS